MVQLLKFLQTRLGFQSNIKSITEAQLEWDYKHKVKQKQGKR